jgi:hypothetical protein
LRLRAGPSFSLVLAKLLHEVHPELGAETEFVQEVLLVTPVGLDFDK